MLLVGPEARSGRILLGGTRIRRPKLWHWEKLNLGSEVCHYPASVGISEVSLQIIVW